MASVAARESIHGQAQATAAFSGCACCTLSVSILRLGKERTQSLSMNGCLSQDNYNIEAPAGEYDGNFYLLLGPCTSGIMYIVGPFRGWIEGEAISCGNDHQDMVQSPVKQSITMNAPVTYRFVIISMIV